MLIDRNWLIEQFTDRLESDKAAVFVGAGLSVGSGLKAWKNLLSSPAKAIGLDVERESHDLPQLAQYLINEAMGNESLLRDHIIKEFTSNIHPNQSHKILARLPFTSIWTTNYDCLIESALKAEGKKIDAVVGNKGWTKPTEADVTVYKMHGSIGEEGPQDLVVTRRHYEEYASKYPRMWEEFRRQLVSRSFLFIGFSFTDPNVNFAFALARAQLDGGTSPHFLITRRSKELKYDEYLSRKFDLWVKDLGERNIYTLIVEDYAEVPELLRAIEFKIRCKRVFVSGSQADDSLHDFCVTLGAELANRAYILISAYGKNVGEYVAAGAIGVLLRRGKPYEDYIELYPWAKVEAKFPDELVGGQRTIIRNKMIKSCGTCIFISGAKGTYEEFEIAKKWGKLLIPVGFTGGAATRICKELLENPAEKGSIMPDVRFLENLMDLQGRHPKDIARELVDIIKRSFPKPI